MSASIRVLHCIHSLAGGGAERQLCLLANHSKGNGIEHGVFCVSPAGVAPTEVAMPVFQASSRATWNWQLWPELSRTMREFQPQIVHAWLPASMTIPALALAHGRGARAVYSYRSRMYFHRPLSIPEWLMALLRCDRVVSNTPLENCSAAYRFLYRMKGGVCIPNGVVGEGAVRKRNWELGAGGAARLLFVGRLAPQKNVDGLLRALALLQDMPWSLAVCGQGDEEAGLRAQALKLGIAGRIEWLGYRGDARQLMAAYDMLVLPSWREGSPNVALEAMVAGLPCVLSRIPAHVSLFEVAGAALLFDLSSSQSLALALRTLMADETLRASLAARAAECVSAFSPAGVAASYARFYQDVLAERA